MTITNTGRILFITNLFLFFSMVAFGQYSMRDREKIEWCDIWIDNANDTTLPKVLLIGNSIARAYHSDVSKLLETKASVSRLTTAQFLADPMLLSFLATVLDHYHFDVIHFNNGMHGWQHSETRYKEAFTAYLKLIREHAPTSKLIWASTTPIKEDPVGDTSKKATNERVRERNRIALEFIRGKNIAVDDLYALMKDHRQSYTDNVHFNKEAVSLQAKQVAQSIETALQKK